MKALLDTNIIIHRENNRVTNSGVGLLFYWLDKLNFEKCIHPYSIQELDTFQDKNMQELYDVKLSAYTKLKTIAPQTEEFKNFLPKELSKNDKIDNQLLCEVFNKRIDILITEDKGLRKKSESFGIRNRVLSINEFITQATENNPDLINYKILAVKKEFFGNIDLQNAFFDTFRIAYYGFDNWFTKKSDEEAYICKTENDDILGFLYLKTELPNENYSDITPVFTSKKRLKIGTFKVESSGFRLGERFIKIIFDNALERNVDEIYVTLFEDRPELKALGDLLSIWGFEKYGRKITNGKEEIVLVKKLKHYNAEKSVKENYPNFTYNKQKFILPILAKYHTTLLPDSKLKTENEVDFLGKIPHRYALQKTYISWAPERNIFPGDFLIFYRMSENSGRKKYESVLTTIGIVEKIHYNFRTKEEFCKICQNRSVFSQEYLDYFWKRHQHNLMVIKFIYLKSLTKRLNLDYLWEKNIISAPSGPRPFARLENYQFTEIMADSQTEMEF